MQKLKGVTNKENVISGSRGRRLEVFYKKAVLKNFARFTKNTFFRSLILLNKVAGLMPIFFCNLKNVGLIAISARKMFCVGQMICNNESFVWSYFGQINLLQKGSYFITIIMRQSNKRLRC